MLDRIRERAVGIELSEALNPASRSSRSSTRSSSAVLGGEVIKITYASRPPTVVLMAGLQGSGKTTNAAKLARWFKQQGRNPLLVGADLQRPAASSSCAPRPPDRRAGVLRAGRPGRAAKASTRRRLGRDVLIVDTAGRLPSTRMMEQVRQISDVTSPDYTFLVIDAMTGQDAVTVAESFNDTLALDGVILTKLDGDARGGAALSVKEVGQADRLRLAPARSSADFEQFHPDRLAGASSAWATCSP